MPYQLAESEEVVDDLVSKKIVFRNDNAENSAYLLLNYRDQGPFARYSRDYLNQQLAAYEEKAHHGHADENSVNVFMTDRTLLLFDGGYRRSPFDGWRADFYHNRVVARWGWRVTLPEKGDLLDYLAQNKVYHDVRTEKIHFGTFGSIDYSRTRLIDDRLGYEGDRLVIFVPETSMAIVVDTILNNEPGQKCFANVWHPYKIVKNGNLKGENEHYVLSWPPNVPIRPRSESDTNELWPNVHHADLLVQFLANRDKQTCVDTIERRFLPSDIVYQYEFNYYFAGQRLLFITVLRPHPSDGFDPDTLDDVTLHGDYLEERRYLGLAFEINGEPVTVALKLDQNIGLTNYKGRPMFDWRTGSRKYGNLETDADFAFVRERDDAFEFGMLYGCRLSYRDRTLFEMPLNTHMFQGATDYQVPEIRDKMPRYRDSVKK